MQSATEGEVWWVIESPTPFASTGCTNASKAKRNAIIISGKPNEACVNCMVDMVSAMRTRQMCRAEENIGARMERERKKQRLVSVWNYRLVMWKRKEWDIQRKPHHLSLHPSYPPSLSRALAGLLRSMRTVYPLCQHMVDKHVEMHTKNILQQASPMTQCVPLHQKEGPSRTPLGVLVEAAVTDRNTIQSRKGYIPSRDVTGVHGRRRKRKKKKKKKKEKKGQKDEAPKWNGTKSLAAMHTLLQPNRWSFCGSALVWDGLTRHLKSLSKRVRRRIAFTFREVVHKKEVL